MVAFHIFVKSIELRGEMNEFCSLQTINTCINNKKPLSIFKLAERTIPSQILFFRIVNGVINSSRDAVLENA
jgi:hypothetical protein